MSAHYLYYTKPAQLTYDLEIHGADGIPLDHWSSAQFKKLQPGDHLWIVTVEEGRLYLVGHLPVEQIVSLERAVAYLGREDLYDGRFHAVCAPEHAEHMEVWDVHEQAPELRFESANDRLVLDADGRLAAQQLQSMRRLTPGSVALFEDVWYAAVEDEGEEPAEELPEVEAPGTEGGYVMDAALRRRIEQRAVEQVTQMLVGEGWSVESVEAARCGYDLRATKGKKERHVEVKGTQGSLPAFMITAQELRCADEDPLFELWVVVDALGDEPDSFGYSGDEVRSHFQLQPVQYRAVLKTP